MLVSLKSIREYVSLDGLTAEEIAKSMTFAGIEVEEISYMARGEGLVIGEIIECEAHCDSSHLHVLKVDIGNEVLQIVCGAPNARVGLKVIVAKVGAKLPSLEIKKSTIRGVESSGMCCSLLELGVDPKYLTDYQKQGIEELPSEAKVGEENVLEYLLLDDVVLNISVLANRPDLLSIYNVAKEIGAIFNRKVNIPVYENNVDFESDLKVSSLTPLCKQFSIKEIRDIVIKPSPKWLSSYLMAMGIRSINNIVDIGNYVMLLTGQPLHMYDADKLKAKELIVRDDLEYEFVALDEQSYKVKPKDLLVTTLNEPVCLAGVMGAKSVSVDENSKNIIIEAASFDGASVRRTSSRLGLSSESSSRFIKGTNHFQFEEVLALATYLIKTLCEGKLESNIVTYINEEKIEKVINSSSKAINDILGCNFTVETIVNTLFRLHFNVFDVFGDSFKVKVPSFRLDVNETCDLAEEVIRLLGYGFVEPKLPTLPTRLGSYSLAQSRLVKIKDFLIDKGLYECLTYSLVSKDDVLKFNLLHHEESYSLLNPLNSDRSHFRTHILHSLLESASYNTARQNKDFALFETSFMESKTSSSNHLAIVMVGKESKWGLLENQSYDFYSLKGIVEGIFQILGIEASRYKFDRAKENNELHKGRSAQVIFQNKVIGVFGELHPNKIKEYDLGKNSVVVLELNLDELLFAKVSLQKVANPSKFPSVTRDLAFIVDKSILCSDIIKTIKITGKGIVTNASIFDVYEGEHVEKNKKSIAISITYQKMEGTLLEKEIIDIEDKIKYALTKSFKVELRG